MHYGVIFTVLGGVLLVVWLRQMTPEQRFRFSLRAAVIVAPLLVVWLLISGRGGVLIALLAGLLPFTRRLAGLLQFLPLLRQLFNQGGLGQPQDGQVAGQAPDVSAVRTPLLEMTLDNRSGEMDGRVLQGRYQGRQLSELSIAQLAEMYQRCPGDQQETARLLLSYLEKMRADEWRDWIHSAPQNAPDGRPMTREEAAAVLGVPPDADREAVIQAHRKLMARLHPDKGGSSYLATKINQAKDCLLDEGSA
jgi:hypothetical protein